MRKISNAELGRPTPEEYEKMEKRPVVVVADNIRSLHNIGSLFRTCDAFAVEALWLCGITATPPDREIHKTALGAENTVPWLFFRDSLEAVRALREGGYTVLAAEQAEGAVSLDAFRAEPDKKICSDLRERSARGAAGSGRSVRRSHRNSAGGHQTLPECFGSGGSDPVGIFQTAEIKKRGNFPHQCGIRPRFPPGGGDTGCTLFFRKTILRSLSRLFRIRKRPGFRGQSFSESLFRTPQKKEKSGRDRKHTNRIKNEKREPSRQPLSSGKPQNY